MERPGCDGGVSRGLFGASWGPFGSLWDPPGRLLGQFWRTSIKTEEELQLRFPPPLGAPKVGSRCALRAFLERSWVRSGPSWGSLEPLLEPSWAILGPSRGSERATMQKSLRCLKCLKDVGLFGGSLGGAHWPLGATHSVAAYMAGAAAEKKTASARLSHGLRPRPPRTKLPPPMLAP